jgi:uncharacterized protein (TIGR02145 family)
MKKYILIITIILMPFVTFSQVGIGTTDPYNTSILDLTASNKALLLPRVANTAAVAVPVNGMMIYDISSNCVKSYENSVWTGCLSATQSNIISNTVTVNCDTAGFVGNMINAVVNPNVATGVHYRVTLTNNTFASVTIPLTAADLVLTGANAGLSVTTISATAAGGAIASVTMAAGASSTVFYRIAGTPTTIGTITGTWTKGVLTCAKTVNVQATQGQGSLSGKTCFDIALGNDNANSCGPLVARITNKSDFTQSSTNTQSYTFRPIGTVSNVRFIFTNINGTVINSVSGNNTGNNISTPVVATVNYNTNLNTLAAGLTNNNALTAEITVIYNDGATNNGTDRQLKLITNVKDCACCVVKVSATEFKEFLCHNLGANTTLDPHDMAQANAWGLNGAYIQWGKRGPNTTGDSRADWVTAVNNVALGFVAAPTGSTAGTANSAAIAGWSTSAAADLSWRTAGGAKTANDPCPAGYRVPTRTEWSGVNNNNTLSRSGTWTQSATNYNSAIHFGPNASTKLLTLPAAGWRDSTDGSLNLRGLVGLYWTSNENGSSAAQCLYFDTGSVDPLYSFNRIESFPIRCIAE